MENTSEEIYLVALTLIPQIGDIQARILLQHFGTAAAVFRASKRELELLEGIGRIKADSIRSFNKFSDAEAEVTYAKKHGIRILHFNNEQYPRRLKNCYDPPVLLFYKGNTDLNNSKVVGIVGTRNCTAYGRQVTERIVEEISDKDILIISGLAFGIDAVAHRSALTNNLPTVGVVAHGLASIYPREHSSLAAEILRRNGGILTQFPSNTQPDKHNFPSRNRIVAGMSDAIIVIETGSKGGSLITADLANGYNRDVFAVPGRVNDPKSEGCLNLISSNRACLLQNGRQLLEHMGWDETVKQKSQQTSLFHDLEQPEAALLRLLIEEPGLHIDQIAARLQCTGGTVATHLLALELKQLIAAMPGNRYRPV